MDRRSILMRLKKLEKGLCTNLPEVYAVYEDGTIKQYQGTPPFDDIFSVNNPIVRTYGSCFADLINSIIHPLENRNIGDFENEEVKELEKGEN